MMLSALKKYPNKRMAAREMVTSVDTLNKYIESLEKTLGMKLITTTEKGSFLTVDGEKVISYADLLTECLNRMSLMTPCDKDITGEVRVAYDKNVRCNIYVKELDNFFTSYPNLSISVDTFDFVPEMSDKAYDISLSYDVPNGNDVVIILAKKTACGFFASAEYLSKHPYPRTMEELLEKHRLIMKRDSWKWMENASKIIEQAKMGICLTNSTFVVNELTIGGAGVAVMPLNFAKEGQGLVCLDNINCRVNSTIYLSSHKIVKDIPRVRVVLDYYKKLLGNL